jgi:hypothetical protein
MGTEWHLSRTTAPLVSIDQVLNVTPSASANEAKNDLIPAPDLGKER